MSYDQKPARMRVIDGAAAEPRQRSDAAGPITGGFATGPAPRRRSAPRSSRLGRRTISILFLTAALIGGAVQALLLIRP